MYKIIALCPFLTRDHVLGVSVPLPFHYHTVAVPRGIRYLNVTSRSLKKGRSTKFINLPLASLAALTFLNALEPLKNAMGRYGTLWQALVKRPLIKERGRYLWGR
jgi:hypothetical protein